MVYLMLKNLLKVLLILHLAILLIHPPFTASPLYVSRRISLCGYELRNGVLTATFRIWPGPKVELLAGLFKDGIGWLDVKRIAVERSSNVKEVNVLLRLPPQVPPEGVKLCLYIKEDGLWRLIVKERLRVQALGPLLVPYFSSMGNNWSMICCLSMLISYYGLLVHPWEVAAVTGKKYFEDLNLYEAKRYVEGLYGRHLSITTFKFTDPNQALTTIYLNLKDGVPVILTFSVKGRMRSVVVIGFVSPAELVILDPLSDPSKGLLKKTVMPSSAPIYVTLIRPRGLKPKPPSATLGLIVTLIDRCGSRLRSVWDGEQPYGGCPLSPKGIGWVCGGRWCCPYVKGFPYVILEGYSFSLKDGTYKLSIKLYNMYTFKLVYKDETLVSVKNGLGRIKAEIRPPPYPMPQAPYLVLVELFKEGRLCDKFWFTFYAFRC